MPIRCLSISIFALFLPYIHSRCLPPFLSLPLSVCLYLSLRLSTSLYLSLPISVCLYPFTFPSLSPTQSLSPSDVLFILFGESLANYSFHHWIYECLNSIYPYTRRVADSIEADPESTFREKTGSQFNLKPNKISLLNLDLQTGSVILPLNYERGKVRNGESDKKIFLYIYSFVESLLQIVKCSRKKREKVTITNEKGKLKGNICKTI